MREEIVNGKRRIIITRIATGEDRTREAALVVMGNEYEYINSIKEEKQC